MDEKKKQWTRTTLVERVKGKYKSKQTTKLFRIQFNIKKKSCECKKSASERTWQFTRFALSCYAIKSFKEREIKQRGIREMRVNKNKNNRRKLEVKLETEVEVVTQKTNKQTIKRKKFI